MPAVSMVGKAVGERAGEETGEYPRWSLGYPSTGGSPAGRVGGGVGMVPPSRSSIPLICRFSFMRLFWNQVFI